MRRQRSATIEDLRQAIDRLPRRTRIAMLEGIDANDIIVGAYTTQDGVCPMLAAHRAGGRTNVIDFAKAWDRFAFRDTRSSRARRATRRELLVLRSHLEASLLEEDAPVAELAAARREHLELLATRDSEREFPPDYNRLLARLESELTLASDRERGGQPRVTRVAGRRSPAEREPQHDAEPRAPARR